MEVRFHLDESAAKAIADGLQRRGIDATTPTDVGLLGADDSQHLEFARLHNRVIVTHDADFLRLHADGQKHAGIAYCHQQSRPLGELIRKLVVLHQCLTAEELRGQIEYL